MTWLEYVDTWLLVWFNRWIGHSPETFSSALKISNRAPWILAAALLTWLWFSGDEGWVPFRTTYTRWMARRRVLSILAALVAGFGLARVAQTIVPRPRPFNVVALQVPIVPSVWDKIRASMATQGAFPSDHAVMFFIIVLGLGSLSRKGGAPALVGALFFSALRVGLGFHWPSDMLGGAVIGAIALGLVVLVERVWPQPWDWVIALFYRLPAIAYPVGFLLLFDLSQKFAGLFGLVVQVLGHDVAH